MNFLDKVGPTILLNPELTRLKIIHCYEVRPTVKSKEFFFYTELLPLNFRQCRNIKRTFLFVESGFRRSQIHMQSSLFYSCLLKKNILSS